MNEWATYCAAARENGRERDPFAGARASVMTLRRRFVYRQRSRESVDRHLRRHQRAGAIRLAYHGEPEKLCALLRADGQGDLAALIARGEFTKRNPGADKRTEVKTIHLCLGAQRREARQGEIRQTAMGYAFKTD